MNTIRQAPRQPGRSGGLAAVWLRNQTEKSLDTSWSADVCDCSPVRLTFTWPSHTHSGVGRMVIPSWKSASKPAWAWSLFVWTAPCGRATCCKYVQAVCTCTRTSDLKLVVVNIKCWIGRLALYLHLPEHRRLSSSTLLLLAPIGTWMYRITTSSSKAYVAGICVSVHTYRTFRSQTPSRAGRSMNRPVSSHGHSRRHQVYAKQSPYEAGSSSPSAQFSPSSSMP